MYSNFLRCTGIGECTTLVTGWKKTTLCCKFIPWMNVKLIDCYSKYLERKWKARRRRKTLTSYLPLIFITEMSYKSQNNSINFTLSLHASQIQKPTFISGISMQQKHKITQATPEHRVKQLTWDSFLHSSHLIESLIKTAAFRLLFFPGTHIKGHLKLHTFKTECAPIKWEGLIIV